MQADGAGDACGSVTPNRLADRWGISVRKIHEWIGSGELVALNVARDLKGKPQWIITAEAIANFEAKRSSKPSPKPPVRRRQPTRIKHFF